MNNIKKLDEQLLKEVFEYQKEFMKNHEDCKDGIDFPDGTHSCKKIEQATSKTFKEKYNQNFLMKFKLLGLE